METMVPGTGHWTYFVPLVLVAIIIFRSLRTRTLKVERLWLMPTLLLLVTTLTLIRSPPSGLLAVVLGALSLGLGTGLGWWRAQASWFQIDPTTHVITSKVSPWGVLLILAIFGVRYVVRTFATTEASILDVTAADITDSFLLMAVGLVTAQRVEWYLRARRMIEAARAGLPPSL